MQKIHSDVCIFVCTADTYVNTDVQPSLHIHVFRRQVQTIKLRMFLSVILTEICCTVIYSEFSLSINSFTLQHFTGNWN